MFSKIPGVRRGLHRHSIACTLCLATIALTACSSDSESFPDTTPPSATPDPMPPSANIEPTRALVEQAERDWQAAGLQDYAYMFRHDQGSCHYSDGSEDADPGPMSMVFVPADGAPYQFTFYHWDYHYAETFTQNGELAQGYESIFGEVYRVLDDEPVKLGRTWQNSDELPFFDERGVLESLVYQTETHEAQCSYAMATDRMVDVTSLSYPLHDIKEALEAGYTTWQDTDLQNYTYRARYVSGSCEAPEMSELFTVRVVDGEVVETENYEDSHYNPHGPTMEHAIFNRFARTLFDLPEVFRGSHTNNEQVSFDPNFGFPLSFYAERTVDANGGCRADGLILESFE